MLDHWILNKYQIKNSLLCVSLAVRRDCQLDYNVVDVLKLLLSFFFRNACPPLEKNKKQIERQTEVFQLIKSSKRRKIKDWK